MILKADLLHYPKVGLALRVLGGDSSKSVVIDIASDDCRPFTMRTNDLLSDVRSGCANVAQTNLIHTHDSWGSLSQEELTLRHKVWQALEPLTIVNAAWFHSESYQEMLAILAGRHGFTLHQLERYLFEYWRSGLLPNGILLGNRAL